jgi:uncharacterized Zn-finger protein
VLSGALVKHVERVHSTVQEKNFVCRQCKKAFAENMYLERHIRRVHVGLKPHSCPVCNRKFSDSGNVTRHLRIHTRDASVTSAENRVNIIMIPKRLQATPPENFADEGRIVELSKARFPIIKIEKIDCA